MHRYPDRVLLKLVHVCAVYCRFCFRREMVGPGKATALPHDAYRGALDYIRAHPEIWEVILTGGDPLMLSPRRLAEIMADLAAIDHVKIIRLHTRVPVADPARDQRRTGRGAEGRRARRPGSHCTPIMPRELTRRRPRRLRRAWSMPAFRMVSQSVLLRGVNDDAATLEALMRAFVECRIKPYYLHHGDLAPGTAHLRTTLAHGQELMRALRGGYPACASRTMCSIFPAAMARRRSARIICRRQILFPDADYSAEQGEPVRNRAIVLSITAATFISIRRSHDASIMRSAAV